MGKQKSEQELTKEIRLIVADFLSSASSKNGDKKKTAWGISKQVGVSGPTIIGFIVSGGVGNFQKFVKIINFCGYTVDEIKISKK